MPFNIAVLGISLLLSVGCDEGEIGDRGKRGPVGAKGLVGDAGPRGEQGTPGDNGAKGMQGATGQNGTLCNGVALDGGTQILCADGTSATVYAGTDGHNGTLGTQGDNGDDGQAGTDGITCLSENNDAGTFVRCSNGILRRIQQGQQGVDGASCHTETTEEGLRVTCSGMPELMIYHGQNGNDGQQGQNGENGTQGQQGLGCVQQETVSGIDIICDDTTQSAIIDGTQGDNADNGNDGEAGLTGMGCTSNEIGNGLDISCANDTLRIEHSPGCSFTENATGTEVTCTNIEGTLTTSETMNHHAYVEPFGMGATNNQLEESANTTYFILFETPVTGTYNHFALFQGDEPNDGNLPDLEIAIFEETDGLWQLQSDGSVFDFNDLNSVDYRHYVRSGLGAHLNAHTPYLFVLRITGTTWRFSNHNGTASAAPFTAWKKTVTESLSTYSTTLANGDGTRVIPWFRVSQ